MHSFRRKATTVGLSRGEERRRTPATERPWPPERRRSGAGSDREGVAATELALILPLVLLIVLGCIDLGRFAHSYLAVTNGARAGAGWGIMNPFGSGSQAQWQTTLRAVVADEMQGIRDYNDADLVVYPPYPDGWNGRTAEDGGFWRIRVEVRYPFETLTPWPFVENQTIMLERAIVMRGIR